MGALYQPVIGWVCSVIAWILHVGKIRLYEFCGSRCLAEPVGAFGWYPIERSVQFPVGALAGIARTWFFRVIGFLLSGETELGSAEEQPNKG
jgi:hypothetical protein